MPFYYRLGDIPHKRHTQFRKPDGGLYREQVMGVKGFSGIQSILYHAHHPTEVRRVEDRGPVCQAWEEPGAVRHRLVKTAAIPASGDAVTGRVALFGNQDVTMSVVRPNEPMEYFYRNGQGDEVLFVHTGSGRLETNFGELAYGPGDYLVIPIGTTWRMVMDADVEHRLLAFES